MGFRANYHRRAQEITIQSILFQLFSECIFVIKIPRPISSLLFSTSSVFHRANMAISMLSLPKPTIIPSFRNPQKTPHFLPKSTSSISSPSTSSLPEETSPCISYNRRRLIELGIGVLAFPLFSVSDANATRIQYYATVGEKLCDMNFVKSGLGFCDVSIGTGIQPPRGELINVSSYWYFSGS